MQLTCVRCEDAFENEIFLGYCPECIEHFRTVSASVNRCQNPTPDMHLDGKFTDDPGPQTVLDSFSGRAVCGLCGSDEVQSGYGLGSGRGIGSYSFCMNCNTFLDFCPDMEDE